MMTDNTTIVPYQADDLQGVLGVLAQAMPQDPISPARFTQQVLLDPNFRAEGALVARREGRIAGFCLAMARQVPLENAPPDGDACEPWTHASVARWHDCHARWYACTPPWHAYVCRIEP